MPEDVLGPAMELVGLVLGSKVEYPASLRSEPESARPIVDAIPN